MKNKQFFVISFIGLVVIIFPLIVFAVCPVCTVAIAGGVGLARWLKVDDVVSGAWVGALLIAFSFWFGDWLAKRKGKDFVLSTILSAVMLYIFTAAPLWWKDIIGHPFNTMWGIDKIILGIGFGTVIMLFSIWLDHFIKKSRNGQVLFYYQKVAIPIALLLIFSFGYWYLCKCNFL